MSVEGEEDPGGLTGSHLVSRVDSRGGRAAGSEGVAPTGLVPFSLCPQAWPAHVSSLLQAQQVTAMVGLRASSVRGKHPGQIRNRGLFCVCVCVCVCVVCGLPVLCLCVCVVSEPAVSGQLMPCKAT